MVSRNCYVGSSKIPLSKNPFGASSLGGILKSKFDVRKGVVFVNDTSLDWIPSNFSI